METAKKQQKYLNEFIKLRNHPVDYRFFSVNQTIIVFKYKSLMIRNRPVDYGLFSVNQIIIVFKYKSLMIISIRVDEYCLKQQIKSVCRIMKNLEETQNPHFNIVKLLLCLLSRTSTQNLVEWIIKCFYLQQECVDMVY